MQLFDTGENGFRLLSTSGPREGSGEKRCGENGNDLSHTDILPIVSTAVGRAAGRHSEKQVEWLPVAQTCLRSPPARIRCWRDAANDSAGGAGRLRMGWPESPLLFLL